MQVTLLVTSVNPVTAQSETAVCINKSLWTNLAGDAAGDVSESCGGTVRDRCLYKYQSVDKPLQVTLLVTSVNPVAAQSESAVCINISLWTNLAGDAAGDFSESCGDTVRDRCLFNISLWTNQ